MLHRTFCLVFFGIFLTGCASQTINVKNPDVPDINNSKTFSERYDKIWDSIVEGLSKSFFVINNIEKESGIINVSFSTQDPRRYVDCGSAVVKTNDSTQYFDVASSNTRSWVYQQGMYKFIGEARRQTSLDGRVNLFVKSVNDKDTLVRVNTRYIMSFKTDYYKVNNQFLTTGSNTVSFNTNSTGSVENITCSADGSLENKLLDLIDAPISS